VFTNCFSPYTEPFIRARLKHGPRFSKGNNNIGNNNMHVGNKDFKIVRHIFVNPMYPIFVAYRATNTTYYWVIYNGFKSTIKYGFKLTRTSQEAIHFKKL